MRRHPNGCQTRPLYYRALQRQRGPNTSLVTWLSLARARSQVEAPLARRALTGRPISALVKRTGGGTPRVEPPCAKRSRRPPRKARPDLAGLLASGQWHHGSCRWEFHSHHCQRQPEADEIQNQTRQLSRLRRGKIIIIIIIIIIITIITII